MSQWNCHQTEAYQEDLPSPTSNSKGNQLHFGRPSKNARLEPPIESSLQKMSTIKRAEKGWGGSQNPKDLTRCFLAKLANSQVLWGEIIKSRESTVMANLIDMPESDFEKWCSIDKESIITPSTDTVSRKCRFSGCSHLNYSATQSTARSQHCQLA